MNRFPVGVGRFALPVENAECDVGFLDGGNVFRRVSDVDLSRIRGTAGFGVRWDSPLGPLRVDAGFKLSRLVFNGRPERLWELHLSIGEAF